MSNLFKNSIVGFPNHLSTNKSISGSLAMEKQYYMSGNSRKPVFRVCDQVQHKPACAITEDGQKLEISEVVALYYPCSENKDTDQLYCTADLRLCFRIFSRLLVSSFRGSYYMKAASGPCLIYILAKL